MSSQKLSGLHELRHGPQQRWTAGTARMLGDVGSKEPQECRTAKTARGIVYIYIGCSNHRSVGLHLRTVKWRG